MNKPKIIYLIAIWSFIQTAFYLDIPIGIMGKALELSPEYIKILKLFGQIGSIVVIVGLVQLKKNPRIISVALLSIASLLIMKILFTFLYKGSNHTIRTPISFTIMLIFNIGCIWYLLRKKFIEYSEEYRKYLELQKKLTTLK